MKKLFSRSLFSLAAFILAFSLAVSANAITLAVTSAADAGGTCPGATCTLRQAIATAASGDIINFAAGITKIDLTTAELFINKNVTISGPGANVLTVERSSAAGTPNFRIFHIFSVSNITVAISGMTVTNGDAQSTTGGGILNDGGTVSVTNCAVTGNSANIPGGFGGGIVNDTGSKMTITNCTISGNLARLAGGISNGTSNQVDNSGTIMTISNSTISGNITAASCACGGGGGLVSVGTATIINSTIFGNSAPGTNGGGINVSTGTVTVRNTIIALNTAMTGPDVAGTLTSQGYNLIGNNSGATVAPKTGDQIGTAGAPINPMLGLLQDNGGPTQTQALLSGSPAIEKGDSGGTSTDQRGFARPVDSPNLANVGDGSDIGAYEVQADVLPGCATINRVVKNANDSGADSLRGVIASVCVGSTITFDPNVTGKIGLTSGELLVNKSLTIVGPGSKVISIGRGQGAPNFRIFNVAANVNVAISGLNITEGNAASDAGGGISNHGTLTLTYDSIVENSALIGGGGIHNNGGTLTVNNCYVYFNSTNNGGGGILNSSGTLTVTNTTVSTNMAQNGKGGGIANSGTTNLFSSTVASNAADAAMGGGIHNFSGTVTVRNSIIALNTASSVPDYNGTLTSQGFNLIGNSSGATISPALFTDQVGTAASPIDPLLSLLDISGPIYTRGLLTNSPAIDKGDSGGLTTDQRGFPRPIDLPSIANATGGDGSDIGAFEVQATTLANISTRLRVETGDGALFAGFIVTGTQPKKVIIRAIGPSIALADHLADPILELHDSFGATLDSNDNWQDSANKQAIIDSTVAPTNPLESAIVATLPAGNAGYTAIIRGANNGTGIGVVEAYDLDARASSKLANISTRGFVATGDNVLFAGTIVLGQVPQKVIIRALGPSVPVAGAMADPTLELRDHNGGLLEANDNWVDSPNKQAIIDSTIPPTNNAESAIVYTLPANTNYTAIVRGVNNTTGIAVVEVYALN
jgi:hypothetical protein